MSLRVQRSTLTILAYAEFVMLFSYSLTAIIVYETILLMDPNTNQQPQSPQPAVEQTPVPPKPSVNSKIFLIAVIVLIVILIGLITYILTTKTKPTSQSPAISPTFSQPSPTPVETASWKEYKNTALHYALRYPENFIFVSKDPKYIIISSDTLNATNPDPSFAIWDRSSPKWKTANDACEAEVCSNVNFGWKKEQVKINNFSGVKLIDTEIASGGYEDYYLSSPDGTIIVRIIIGTTNNDDFLLLKKILSTFRFD